jgi:hypothetical protein
MMDGECKNYISHQKKEKRSSDDANSQRDGAAPGKR